MSETLRYTADGLSMLGELFRPERPSGRPAVIVFPEAFGLGDHALDRARRLAERGHVALAADLHGDRRLYADMAELGPVFQPLREDVAKVRARARGALDALAACEGIDAARTVASGYCFGGTMALELVRDGAPIVAAVGFHSGLATTAPAPAGHDARVLVCIGADDPGIPPEQRAGFEQEMKAAGLDWQLHVYGGVVHSFTNPEADARNMPQFARYDAQADARSWRAFTGLLDELTL